MELNIVERAPNLAPGPLPLGQLEVINEAATYFTQLEEPDLTMDSLSTVMLDWLWHIRNRYYIHPLDRLRKPWGTLGFLLSHWAVPGYNLTLLFPDDELYVAYNLLTGERYSFPEMPGVAELRDVSVGYASLMRRKYMCPGFADIESGDLVVDVGAFVGGFSMAIADQASRVLAFEPSSANALALRRNIQPFDNITVHEKIVSNECGTARLKLSSDSTDHSILAPDRWETKKYEVVEAVRLDSIGGMPDNIDFVKIDAEGFEPEVIRGTQRVTVQKFAVDCSAEREGSTTTDEVTALLDQMGYETRNRGSMVYGRLAV